jgi:hypothetical protein
MRKAENGEAGDSAELGRADFFDAFFISLPLKDADGRRKS